MEGKGPGSVIWGLLYDTRERKQPQFQYVPYVGPNKSFMKTTLLFLPLASDHQHVDKIFLVSNFIIGTNKDHCPQMKHIADSVCQWCDSMLRAMKKLFIKQLKRTLFVAAILFPASAVDADTFTSNGATISYEVAGTGEPVFILHGGLASREDLRGLIDHLAKTHQTVALDSREQGKSSGSDQQISYALMASDVNNLAAHLDLTGITIVGQSDGGITALTAALNYSEVVTRLILLGVNFNHAVLPEIGKEYLRSFKVPKEFDRSQFPGMYLDDYLSGGRRMQDYQTLFDEMANMWTTSPNYTALDMARIDVPVLVISGDREDMPLDHTLALYAALPNAQLLVVPGATHFLQREKPLLLHTAVSTFLAR